MIWESWDIFNLRTKRVPWAAKMPGGLGHPGAPTSFMWCTAILRFSSQNPPTRRGDILQNIILVLVSSLTINCGSISRSFCATTVPFSCLHVVAGGQLPASYVTQNTDFITNKKHTCKKRITILFPSQLHGKEDPKSKMSIEKQKGNKTKKSREKNRRNNYWRFFFSSHLAIST